MTIIVQVMGGLGNQLFQYAAGRSLSLEQKQDLVIDRSWYNQDFNTTGLTARRYVLDRFNVAGRDFSVPKVKLKTWRQVSRISPFSATLIEASCPPRIFFASEPKRRTVINGYWQSEEYFKPFAEIIRSDLSLRVPPPPDAVKWASILRDKAYIGIHIRRGDMSQPGMPERYSTTFEYLGRALELIRTRTTSDKIMIFSDDPAWCSVNLKGRLGAEVMSGQWNEAVEMHLFSSCCHHVISDSTFSWWGAWLKSDKDQVVVAPKQWALGSPLPPASPAHWNFV